MKRALTLLILGTLVSGIAAVSAMGSTSRAEAAVASTR
jgi:hypothetical protein